MENVPCGHKYQIKRALIKQSVRMCGRIHLALDRGYGQTLLNIIVNQSVGNYLNSYPTVSSPRIHMLQWVS